MSLYLIVSITISRESLMTGNVLCSHVSVRGRMPTLLQGPGCNFWNGMGCPLVVHYEEDSQSVHTLRYYCNIMRTQNGGYYMLVFALCLVDIVFVLY